MKKKFILLAMMLLTLIGGVKFNVLNAQQETIEIGTTGTTKTSSLPVYASYYNSVSQQIYTQSEINHESGQITEITFFQKPDSYGMLTSYQRNVVVYMSNTDKSSFNSDPSAWENFTESAPVYSGILQTGQSEVTLQLNPPFEYDGGNLLVCVFDNTDDAGAYGAAYFATYSSGGNRSIYRYDMWGSNGNYTVESILTLSPTVKTENNQIRLTFEAAGDDVIPAAPTNLVATTVDYKSVNLTWDAAENALKYQVWQGENMIAETEQTEQTEYLVDEGLSDGTEYCFTVKSVRYNNNTSDASNESCATTAVLPVPGTPVNLAATNITHNSVTLTWDDVEYAESYTVSYSGGTITVTENTCDVTGLTPETDYTFSVTANNIKGSSSAAEVSATTLEYSDPFAGKLFRIKALTYNTKNPSDVVSGPYSFTSPMYLNISSYNEDDSPYINAVAYAETPKQVFAFEPTGNENEYYLRSASGYYIKCYKWNMGAPSTNVDDASPLRVSYIDETTFYLMNGRSSDEYIKVETGTDDYVNYRLYCDFKDQAKAAKWTVEEVLPEAPAPETAPANLQATNVTHNSVTLTWDVVDGATCYEIYKDAVYLDEVNTSTYTATGLNAETSYSFIVKAGNISGISPESEALSVTTEQFSGRTVVFELNDYYGWGSYDGWSGNKLLVELSTGESYEYTNGGTAATEYHYLDVPYGTTVTVTYLNTGSYASENTYYIRYNDDKSLIYQDGRAVNGGNAPTANNPFSFTVERPGPENLAIVEGEKNQLYPGETTEISWDALEGVIGYNVYVNEVKFNTEAVEGLSYVLVNLPYGMNTIAVAAVFADDSESGMSNTVTVQVAGTFTLTVNVTDGTKPIEGATVNIDMAYACDEFKNQVSSVTVEPTGADGKTTVELPILCQETYFYNNNGTYVYTSYYTVEVSKSPYQDNNWNYINYYDDVTSGYTLNVVLDLPMVDYIQVQDEEGNDLYGYVMEGTNVVLSWDELEGATDYNVYKLLAGEVESSETVEETTYTIESIEKGYQYAVSALFGELESAKNYANIDVKGNGYFKGYVTDGTNALEGIQVKVSSEYGASAVAITDAEGYFNGEIVEGDNYILTISHSDYEEFTSETFTIGYGAYYDFETIKLTAKPSASDITGVTATLNGENVDVKWTVNETSTYTKYNVYRRLAGTQGKGDNIATEVTTTSTTDAEWETLEPGTYQYGVAALVEPQAQTRGTEVIFEEGFENNGTNIPTGWTKRSESNGSGWVVGTKMHTYNPSTGTYYAYSVGKNYTGLSYLETNEFLVYGNATMTFKYIAPLYSPDINTLIVNVIDGEGTHEVLNTQGVQYENWETAIIDLSAYNDKNIKIQFVNKDHWGRGVGIDDIVITGEASSEVETQIVWSNDVVKQGPATFIGGDTENPTAWNVDANWSTGSVPADGAEVTINANAVISSAVNVSNLTINQGDSYQYNKLTVANGGALTVTGTISQASNYLLVLEEGGQIFQNNANVTARFSMSIDNPTDWSTSNKDGWQFISMPLENVSHADFTSYGEYDLYKYDGSQDLEWQNHKDGGFDYGGVPETTFKSSVGYLASLKDEETATVYGTLNTSTSFSSYFAYNADKDLANFRLIGNPFTYDIKWGDMNPHQLADGFAIVNKDGGYEYYSAPDADIKVGQGFFIKAIAGETSYSQYNYSKQRSTRESNNSLNITAAGNAGKDNVVINFAGKSEGFNKLQNFNDAIATVYVAEDGKNYGIYNCDADVQEVELSFNANKMGNYTISIEPNGKFQTVTLVDRFTGVETNMLVEDYNFTAMSEENPNRFIVRMVNGQQTTDNSHFVYQSGEELILNIQGEVQIVDVLGRVVYNGEAMNDINRINVSSFNSGAYMVKVMNGNEVKVEKVVIY